MVVVCESCSTRFRIDDAQIPAKGRLVRCSQCKATFVAKPDSDLFEETVQEVVEEVTAAGGMPVPEPSLDLFAAGGAELGDSARGSDEERWEFDETPRGSSAPPALDSEFGVDEFEDARSTLRPTEAPLEEVGDPAEWDLLNDSVEPAAREAKFVEPEAPPPRVSAPPRSEHRAVEAPALPVAVAEDPPPRRIERPALTSSLARLGRLGLGAAAWCALVALGALGATPLLGTEVAAPQARLLPKSFALPDGEAHAVEAHFVENAFAGTLLVIRGELARPAGDPRLGLRVQLVDASGAHLGGARWAGVAPPPEALRLRAPETLAEEIEASAAAVARGGPFLAVLEMTPNATGFVLALEPLPAPEAPLAGASAAPADATASSAPASLPSSE